jgi:hypothetical protein
MAKANFTVYAGADKSHPPGTVLPKDVEASLRKEGHVLIEDDTKEQIAEAVVDGTDAPAAAPSDGQGKSAPSSKRTKKTSAKK